MSKSDNSDRVRIPNNNRFLPISDTLHRQKFQGHLSDHYLSIITPGCEFLWGKSAIIPFLSDPGLLQSRANWVIWLGRFMSGFFGMWLLRRQLWQVFEECYSFIVFFICSMCCMYWSVYVEIVYPKTFTLYANPNQGKGISPTVHTPL